MSKSDIYCLVQNKKLIVALANLWRKYMLGRVSVKKPFLVIVMIIIVLIMGVISYTQMSIDFLPNMNFPYLVAVTVSPGLSPQEIESQVTNYIEDAVQGIQKVEQIISMSMEHASIVIMQFASDANLDTAVLDLQTALGSAKDNLPADAMDSLITKINPTMLPIMNFTIAESGKSIGDSSEYLTKIYDDIRRIDGVSSVDQNGLTENQALVIISKERLTNSIDQQLFSDNESLNPAQGSDLNGDTDGSSLLTTIAGYFADMILSMLDSDTVGLAIYAQNLEVPAGSIIEGIGSYLVKLGDKISTAEELENLPVMTIDFQKLFENYDDILEVLKLIQIDQSLIDSLKSFSDEDGVYQKAIARILQGYYDIIDSNTIFEFKNSEKVYVIKHDILDQLDQFATWGELDSIDLSAIPDATWTAIAASLAISRDELFEYLELIPFFALTYEENGSPQALTLNESIKNLLLMATDLKEELSQISITLEEVDSVAVSIQNLADYGKQIAALVSTIETDILIERTDIFEPVYKMDSDGNYTDEVDYYRLQIGYIELLQKLPELKLTIGAFAEVYHLNTASKILNLVNGSAGVMVSVNKQPDYSTVDVSNAVKEYLKETKAANSNFEYLILSDQGESVMMMINSLVKNILIGMGLAIIILFLFLRDVRATLIVAMSMIISIIAAFVLMYFAGISLNILSLSGLCLGVGMLVDNSIVVLENIYKLRSEGKSVYRACVEGAKQMGGAITASTITTIIVFVPLIFLKGITQQIIMDIALTLSFSLIASLVVALTLVPMASSYMLKKPAKKESKWFHRFKEFYGKVLDRILRYRLLITFNNAGGLKNNDIVFQDNENIATKKTKAKKVNASWIIPEPKTKRQKNSSKDGFKLTLNFKVITLVLAVILLLGAGTGLISMKRIFFPATDAGTFTLSVSVDRNKLPSDKTYDENIKEIIDYIYKEAKSIKDVADVGVELSAGFNMMGVSIGAGNITAYVTLTENSKNSSEDVAKTLKEKCMNMRWLSSDSYSVSYNADSGVLGSMGDMMAGNTLSIIFTGNDLEAMRDNAVVLAEIIDKENIPGVVSVDNGVSDAAQEYHVVLDKEKAAAIGLTVGQIYQMLSKDFEIPTSSATVNYPTSDGTTSKGLYNVIVYRDVYEIERWYVLDLEIAGVTVGTEKAYIERDTKSGKDSYYVLVSDEKVSLSYDSNTNTFTYNADKFANYKLKSSDANLITYYDILRKEEIDISTYPIKSTISLGDLGQYDVQVELWQICDEESFIKDENGNVMYKITGYEKDQSGYDKVDENGNRIPIYEYLTEKDANGDALKDGNGNIVYAYDKEGKKIPIPVGIKKEAGYMTIVHTDGVVQMTVTVKVDIEKYNITSVSGEVEKVMNSFREALPEGISVDFEGEQQMIIDVYQTLLIVLGVGIVLIYLVMVAQFQSAKLPFIIMFTIPLAFTGSVFALLVSGFPISVVAMVGLIILMGVVVNNGIVFIDNVRRLIDSGLSKHDALVKTARERLRPILMTALTTIIALFGMALDGSASGAMMQPMGIATLGGLFYATFLTLFVVPIMFDLLDKGRKSRYADEDKDIEFQDDNDKNNQLESADVQPALVGADSKPELVGNDYPFLTISNIEITNKSVMENNSATNNTDGIDLGNSNNPIYNEDLVTKSNSIYDELFAEVGSGDNEEKIISNPSDENIPEELDCKNENIASDNDKTSTDE
jgi:HAE1 family hydrophobic/amphiphilic exporter-1